MKLRRDDLAPDPAIERELEALEAGLAGKPVDPDLADLAALARELRGLRSTPSPDFAASLDAKAAEGFGGRRGGLAGLLARLGEVPPRRGLLPAGAAALGAIAVATALVSLDGPGGGNGGDAVVGSGGGAVVRPSASGEAAAPKAGAAADSGAAGITSGAGAPTSASGPFASGQRHRAVERSAQIVLGTDPEGVQPAADRVFETVGRYDGIVLSSSIRDGASGEAGAEFSLLVPSDRLGAALADLSSIGEVRSRSESTLDITAPTVSVGEHLRDARAEVEGLLKQLAAASTDAERQAVKAQLRFQRRRIAALRASFNDLRRRANFSRVSLEIATGDQLPVASEGDGSWGVGDALREAGRILTVAGGVALIGLALLGPIALLALAAWLGRRAWVRARRERALDS